MHPSRRRPSALERLARGLFATALLAGSLFAVPRASDDFEALAGDDAPAFEAAWERLVARGADAALAALEGWESAGPAGRVARARLLVELAAELASAPAAEGADGAERGSRRLVPLLAPDVTPEPEARVALAQALGTPALARAAVDALEDLAASDPSAAVRTAALQALADSAEPAAAPALDRLLRRLPDDERPAAARALASLPAGRARVVARVQDALLGPADALESGGLEALRHHATLAQLARGYGRALAELPGGGEEVRERAPFFFLRVHPAPGVRLQGARALDRFLSRLVELREEERAERVLALAAEDGLAPHEVLYRRARLALAGRGDAESARRRSEELLRAASGGDPTARGWRHYALVLRGASDLALGDLEAARASFRAARDVLRGLVAEREDLRPSLFEPQDHPVSAVGGALMVDRLVDLGLVEVWLSLCALEEGGPVGSDAVLLPLRRAHALLLAAQLQGERTDAVFEARSLDDFLDLDLGPRHLLLGSRELPGAEEGRYLDLQLALGRALATVVPEEVMGFERAQPEDPALRSVFFDDERFQLLTLIARAEWRSAERAWRARSNELAERARREDDEQYLSRDFLRTDPEYRRFLGLWQRQQDGQEARQRATPEELRDPAQRARLHPDLRELRTPSLYALTLAGELRADGRSDEARALAEGMLADLRDSTGQSALWQEWIAARLELAIASAWMDEDRPREAERAGTDAVRRLEALERSIEDLIGEAAGEPGSALGLRRQLRQIELLRADALLSLAVNANVRGGDPERALRFFERAYELDQREFMRVLLACYRARSGRQEEARAVLRGVQPAPSLFYNLACTHALLGDTEEALEYLRREFEENQPSPGALARQKRWAREDPDLASLRDEPRFQRLTEPSADDG